MQAKIVSAKCRAYDCSDAQIFWVGKGSYGRQPHFLFGGLQKAVEAGTWSSWCLLLQSYVRETRSVATSPHSSRWKLEGNRKELFTPLYFISLLAASPAVGVVAGETLRMCRQLWRPKTIVFSQAHREAKSCHWGVCHLDASSSWWVLWRLAPELVLLPPKWRRWAACVSDVLSWPLMRFSCLASESVY